MFVTAISLTPAVNNWLANSRDPRILHIFDRACNLINERREVLSIVTPQIGNGPFNLVVKDDVCFHDYPDLESCVSVSLTQASLGNLTVQIQSAKLWNPQPDWEKLHTIRDNISNQIIQSEIANQLSKGFDTIPGEHSDLLNQPVPSITRSLVSSLSLAFRNADNSSALKITSQLAGLGAGMTPAGDDLIMGAIYATWIIHPNNVASLLAQEIADTASPLTSSLSAAWLRSAGKGEAGIVWHEFFDALVSANTSLIQETMKNILAVGETSGCDAMAGFCSVFLP